MGDLDDKKGGVRDGCDLGGSHGKWGDLGDVRGGDGYDLGNKKGVRVRGVCDLGVKGMGIFRRCEE